MTSFGEKTNSFFDKYYSKKNKTSGNKSKSLILLDNFYQKHICPSEINVFLEKQVNINIKNCKVLDIGCGNGEYLFALSKAKKNGLYTGVDNSLVAINEANKKLKTTASIKNNNPTVSFVQSNAEKLVFKDGHFDYVLIIGLLHHVENYQLVINEAKRVLKTNGELIIIDLIGDNLFYSFCRIILSFFPKKITEYLFQGDLIVDGKLPKRSKISSRRLRDYLRKNNLHIEFEEYYYLFFQYFYYFYKLFPGLFVLLLPFNKLLGTIENKLKNKFKYCCDLYIYICNKTD